PVPAPAPGWAIAAWARRRRPSKRAAVCENRALGHRGYEDADRTGRRAVLRRGPPAAPAQDRDPARAARAGGHGAGLACRGPGPEGVEGSRYRRAGRGVARALALQRAG